MKQSLRASGKLDSAISSAKQMIQESQQENGGECFA
jgi:hypothetical protein